MLNIHKLLDLLPMILAIAAGILAYKKLLPFYRILLLQVFVFTVLDLYGVSLLPKNNTWVFNISTTIEISLVILAARMYFQTIISKRIMTGLNLLFLLLLTFEIYYSGIDHLAYHTYIFGGILITVTYLSILFFHFFGKQKTYTTSPLILTCLGIVIYFACIIPYLSVMYLFQEQNSGLNKELFIRIVGDLGRLRYFLVALAFLMHWKPFQLKLQNKSHS